MFFKNLGSSKIPPDELEGLEKTFNIYLNLPKSLWPIVKLSESKINWTTILAPLKEFSIEYISEKVQTYDLKDASAAHHDLESRKTTGSIVLKP